MVLGDPDQSGRVRGAEGLHDLLSTSLQAEGVNGVRVGVGDECRACGRVDGHGLGIDVEIDRPRLASQDVVLAELRAMCNVEPLSL